MGNIRHRMMGTKELKQLAMDIIDNKVFGTWNLKNPETEFSMVFMISFFFKEEQIDQFKKDEIIHFYEYYDKAGPRSVNGMPCFFSCKIINKENWRQVVRYVEKYERTKNKFLDEKTKTIMENNQLKLF
jgi:hypothetical protein